MKTRSVEGELELKKNKKKQHLCLSPQRKDSIFTVWKENKPNRNSDWCLCVFTEKKLGRDSQQRHPDQGGREGGWTPDLTSATTCPPRPSGHGNCTHPHPQRQWLVPPQAWDLLRLAGPHHSHLFPWLRHTSALFISMCLPLLSDDGKTVASNEFGNTFLYC